MSVEEAKRLEALAREARLLGVELWKLEMMRGVPDNVIRDIVADARRSSELRSITEKPVERGSGWADETPLKPPEGVQWCDRLVDAQDARDRKEQERERKT